jgi:hypothetical protein
MMDINPSRPDAQQTGERPLNLSDFAQRNQITEDRVWELIEEGELAARFVNDEILILRETDSGGEPQIDLHETPNIAIHDSSEILPTTSVLTTMPPPVDIPLAEPADLRVNRPSADTSRPVDRQPGAGQRSSDDPRFDEGKAHEKLSSHPIPDLFGDSETSDAADNSLPPDDYRDLLVFAQDAMNRTMDLSRQLLATKDELIRMKDERIQQLQTEQQRQEQEMRRLRKKVEDLETLCRLTPNI